MPRRPYGGRPHLAGAGVAGLLVLVVFLVSVLSTPAAVAILAAMVSAATAGHSAARARRASEVARRPALGATRYLDADMQRAVLETEADMREPAWWLKEGCPSTANLLALRAPAANPPTVGSDAAARARAAERRDVIPRVKPQQAMRLLDAQQRAVYALLGKIVGGVEVGADASADDYARFRLYEREHDEIDQLRGATRGRITGATIVAAVAAVPRSGKSRAVDLGGCSPGCVPVHDPDTGELLGAVHQETPEDPANVAPCRLNRPGPRYGDEAAWEARRDLLARARDDRAARRANRGDRPLRDVVDDQARAVRAHLSAHRRRPVGAGGRCDAERHYEADILDEFKTLARLQERSR